MAPSTSPEDRKQATNALVLSILGYVCGGLLTNALTTSPTARVIGTILSGAVPPLIATAGPGHRLRASLAIGVTTLALFAAYGGFAVFAFASDKPSVVPLPRFVPDPAAKPGIELSTESIDCGRREVGAQDSPECGTVTVESTGSEDLVVTEVGFNPQHQGFSQNQNCVKYSPLHKGEQCTVTVMFTPPSDQPGTRSSLMYINENVPNDNIKHVTVRAEVEGSQPQPVGDLVIASDPVCDYVPNELLGGEYKNVLRITFTVNLEDAIGGPPSQVEVSASPVDTPSATTELPETPDSFAVGQADYLEIPLEPQNYQQEAVLTLNVDPDGKIHEIDETNNAIEIKVVLPAQSEEQGGLECPRTR